MWRLTVAAAAAAEGRDAGLCQRLLVCLYHCHYTHISTMYIKLSWASKHPVTLALAPLRRRQRRTAFIPATRSMPRLLSRSLPL